MKKSILLLLTFAVLTVLAGCDLSVSTTAQNPQATIDAAVAATGNAQAAIQAAVEATVAAQATAMVSTATSTPVVVTATAGPASPTATMASEAYATMSEAELAAVVNQAVAEAMAAADQYSTAASATTADNTVTPEEVQTVEVYYAGTEEAIKAAEDLLAMYSSLYAATAEASLTELQAIEQSLTEVSAGVTELNAQLTEINSTLEQGLTLAETTITQVQTTAQTVSAQAQTAQGQLQAWQVAHQPAGAATGGNPQAALQSVFEFTQAGQEILADNQLTPAELTALAQLGSAAGANLGASGAPQLQELTGLIETISGHAGAGNLAEVQTGLDQLGLAATLATPPTQVAGSPREAIDAALQFAALGQQLAAGQDVSPAQLANLAQLGANASAGLASSGMPQLQQLSDPIKEVAGHISLGQMDQAQLGLNKIGGSLQALPGVDLPQKPGGLPGRPK
jgi:hypothetical protein